MLSNLSGWHFIIILFVVLLLFGAPKLPELARSMGQSMKILKTELRPSDDPAVTPGGDTTARPSDAAAATPVTLSKATATPPTTPTL